MDHLRDALKQAYGAKAEAPPAAAAPVEPVPGVADLPDPNRSEWVALLRRLGGEVPASATMGQLVQRSDAHARALKNAGRAREAAELVKAREEFQRDREKKAWSLVKQRFADLELPEKAYRSIKQEEADPVAVLARLTSRRAEELRGAGAARVREILLK